MRYKGERIRIKRIRKKTSTRKRGKLSEASGLSVEAKNKTKPKSQNNLLLLAVCAENRGRFFGQLVSLFFMLICFCLSFFYGRALFIHVCGGLSQLSESNN